MTTHLPGDRRPDDSVEAFRGDLATAIQRSGLSLRQAQERSGWAKSTISRAINGNALPKLDLVVDVLQAAGINQSELDEWRIRHADLAAKPTSDRTVTKPPASTPPPTRWRKLARDAALAVVVAAASSVTTLVVTDRSAPTTDLKPTSVTRPMVVEIQNKVALGVTDLREDSTPTYLSSRTVSFCARLGCKVEGTEMTSGTLLAATCQTVGAELVNFNLDSPDAAKNPNSVRSNLWYKISLPDGRIGYLPEIYIIPRDRGGLGLPGC